MKEIKVIAFGQISEITGKELMLEATDLDSLKLKLIEKFPELSDKKLAFAVNKKMAQDNVAFSDNDVVALMPPYSGG
jgi:Molybdopterin converting factor, small subunit